MTPNHQDQLRRALEKATDKFFRGKAQIIMSDGMVKIDATGILIVLASWVGDLIKGAPEDMRDALFLSFADSVVTLAEIKAEEKNDLQEHATLQ